MVETPRVMPLNVPKSYKFLVDPEGLMDWSTVNGQLTDARNYWLATSRKDGRPHVAPIWAVWVDNKLYWDGNANAQWAKNLRHANNASINLESGSDVVVVEGTVDNLTGAHPMSDQLSRAIDDKYHEEHAEPVNHDWYCLTPSSVRAWPHDGLKAGTRWTFED